MITAAWARTWDDVEPFDCNQTTLDRPLQILRESNNNADPIFLRRLDLDTGDYATVQILTKLQSSSLGTPIKVNAGAMYFENGENFLFAAFEFENLNGRYLCRFDNDTLACTHKLKVAAYAATIVNTTYLYGTGFLNGEYRLFAVRRVDTDGIKVDEPYRILVPDENPGQFFDLMDLQNECESGFCIEGSTGTNFVLGLSYGLKALLVVETNLEGIPIRYLWIYGLNVIDEDGNLASSDFNKAGACFTLYSLTGTGIRSLCTSNNGNGHYDLQLPIDATYCDGFWNDIDATELKVCDRRCDNCQRPLVGYVLASPVTNQNDDQYHQSPGYSRCSSPLRADVCALGAAILDANRYSIGCAVGTADARALRDAVGGAVEGAVRRADNSAICAAIFDAKQRAEWCVDGRAVGIAESHPDGSTVEDAHDSAVRADAHSDGISERKPNSCTVGGADNSAISDAFFCTTDHRTVEGAEPNSDYVSEREPDGSTLRDAVGSARTECRVDGRANGISEREPDSNTVLGADPDADGRPRRRPDCSTLPVAEQRARTECRVDGRANGISEREPDSSTVLGADPDADGRARRRPDCSTLPVAEQRARTECRVDGRANGISEREPDSSTVLGADPDAHARARRRPDCSTLPVAEQRAHAERRVDGHADGISEREPNRSAFGRAELDAHGRAIRCTFGCAEPDADGISERHPDCCTFRGAEQRAIQRGHGSAVCATFADTNQRPEWRTDSDFNCAAQCKPDRNAVDITDNSTVSATFADTEQRTECPADGIANRVAERHSESRTLRVAEQHAVGSTDPGSIPSPVDHSIE
ncbi:hypothetical protein CTAYLR_001381 [Chrysophaeum taylorii]|uniref:Uncharacterized protein n=1 Tax=Chrysophaeum taylorii TaxID=2483200 RepID=A0AAD7XER6_9STRA|nr:hypothetical protein CTAYLR_001381 [Chrysophaeum taylorii]